VYRFAYSPGGGMKFRLARNMNATFEVRGIKAQDFKWYFRAVGGVSVAF